ncbi:protein-tyrosine phosphatase-like protein [Jimgerdemannia flammicorona]|uniref:protein-tyrosine-phosphatase n=1 Tax=Jimgerdemannia flammicorona TaxID=994334 RepID=A0A433Q1T3_9FUNG|nr:protein-tyrosine phosphatase-like protein [Jimgerdemannia flammicorona]
MSIAYDSPPVPIAAQADYFKPRAQPYPGANPPDETPATGETPYFTAPISPNLNHQDFFNAIQSRHNTIPFNTPAASTPSTPVVSIPGTPVPPTPWSLTPPTPMTLNPAGLAGRRRSPLASLPMPPSAFHLPTTSVAAAVAAGPPAAISSSTSRLIPFTSDVLSRLLTTQSCIPHDPATGVNPNPSVVQSLPNLKRPAHFTQPVLVLDMRSFVHYSQGRVRSSINVCIPNTILRRPTFSLDKVYEAIVSDDDKSRLRKWDTFANIVLYDNNSEVMQDSCAIAYLCKKLLQERYNGSLGYLKGGFEAFSTTHADLCETTAPSLRTATSHMAMTSASAAPPGVMAATPTGEYPPHNPHLDSFGIPATAGPGGPGNSLPLHARRPTLAAQFGPFTAPTPRFENQAFNPFFSNIRQNMELSHGGITERFPIRMPKEVVMEQETGAVEGGKTVRRVLGTGGKTGRAGKGVPKWLREIVKGEGEGEKKLAEMYERIEKQEQRRLQNLMLHHSRSHNHADHPLSIVAGIEKGALNRYTNVWPFEYTRVKIGEVDEGQSDYINASFVQYPDNSSGVSPVSSTDSIPRSLASSGGKRKPEGSCARRQNRRYIVTQGPLPTTFTDFWKIVWEQKSRVIVMLTREEEMNRIKCHCYWPSTSYQPQAYGPLNVTLLTETRLSVSSPEDAIIIRQLTISHSSSPAGTPARTITHLQYTGWQDFAVPDDPVGTLRLVQLTDQAQLLYEKQSCEERREQEEDGVEPTKAARETEVGPMIVHCSAGCGRSGAFCTIDTVMRKMAGLDRLDIAPTDSDDSDEEENKKRALEAEGVADVLYDTVERFREQRVSMVQTLRQYVFCYEAVMWWTLGYGVAKEGVESVAMEVDDE